MKAVVIAPGQPGSDRLVRVPDPVRADGELLVEVLSVGVDGTDDELVAGEYGQAPDGEDDLVIGHESLGRVVEPAGELRAGQLVAAIHLNLEMVLQNRVLVGTVNADRANFEAAVRDLAAVERRWPGWLDRLITRRVPLERYAEALSRGPQDVKVVVDVAGGERSGE